MIPTVLALCLSQFNLEEAPHLDVSQLTVSQLEYEDWRLGEPPSYTPWLTMIGVGVPLAVSGTWLSAMTLDATKNTAGLDALIWGFIDFIAIAYTVVGYGLVVAGGVLVPITRWNRDKFQARRGLVRARLADIQSRAVAAPDEPDLAGARHQLEVTKLQTRRPGLGLPLGLMGGGLGAGALAAQSFLTRSNAEGTAWTSTVNLALEITYVCLFIGLEGAGIATLISRLREREEIDRDLAALDAPSVPEPPPVPPPPPAARLPKAPVLLSYAWAF
jgi:hypothetical protein